MEVRDLSPCGSITCVLSLQQEGLISTSDMFDSVMSGRDSDMHARIEVAVFCALSG